VLFLFENYALDTDRRELRRGAVTIPVEPQVFDLVAYLIENRERVVSKDALIEAIWGGRIVSESALTTRINAARCAIGDSGAEQRLIKTLARKGIRFVGDVREEAKPEPEKVAVAGPEIVTAQRPKAELSRPDKPSVAVVPFANLVGDPQQDYFSDGITEDIITELSRFSELLVIARNSSFQYKGKAVDIRQVGRELGVRYVLEGSVRRSGERVRITAQLIEATTGTHRWAERYDRDLGDVFAVQDEVARAIVVILAAHVNRAEIDRALLKPPAAWEAYDYYLRGAEAFFMKRRTKASVYDARDLLQQSLAIDPDYARAAAMLSQTHIYAYFEPLDCDYLNAAALDRAFALAETAVRLDPRLPQAHAQLGFVLIYKRRHDAAIAEFERAFALNPNFVDNRYASALLVSGEPERAIEALEANLHLDPFRPAILSPGIMGLANYMLKRYRDAVPLLQECVSCQPGLQMPHLWLASTYAQLGQLEEARAEAAEVLRINPGFTIEQWKRLGSSYKNPEDTEHHIEGLRKAGLPES
jgi:adenylate cyclase